MKIKIYRTKNLFPSMPTETNFTLKSPNACILARSSNLLAALLRRNFFQWIRSFRPDYSRDKVCCGISPHVPKIIRFSCICTIDSFILFHCFVEFCHISFIVRFIIEFVKRSFFPQISGYRFDYPTSVPSSYFPSLNAKKNSKKSSVS